MMNTLSKKNFTWLLLMIIFMVFSCGQVSDDPSIEVVIIGGTYLSDDYDDLFAANVMGFTEGGFLPVTGPAGELGDFNFTAMDHSSVNASSLEPFDTAVLNMSSVDIHCYVDIFTAQQLADLVSFVEGGKKLIIYDSECRPGPDYSWMPYPFTTDNPGAQGRPGVLSIVEENTLSSNNPSDPYFIDADHLGTNTDAVGDMNVMTTLDENWCVDMAGTNFNGITGPVHTYADYPPFSDRGLFIYNGLDLDSMEHHDPWLRAIWVFELQQSFNPSGLPCMITTQGISLTPEIAVNEVGEDHMVTAHVYELPDIPLPGSLLTFTILSGPNVGTTGTCNPSDCETDSNGDVTWTYAGIGGEGIDLIKASTLNQAGAVIYDEAQTEWILPPACEDLDGDTYNGYDAVDCPEGDDCDDADPAVNPGAEEICDDGIDNDCDGLIDLDDPDCVEECRDNDGDGYYGYDPELCPEGDDCDDADPAVNPGAEEICDDGIDNDCDGLVDEGCGCDPMVCFDIHTCAGDGRLYAYHGYQFQDIDTSFMVTDYDQLVIFTRGDYVDSLAVEVDGVPAILDLVLDQSWFSIKVYSLQITPGAVVGIEGGSLLGARAVQGYLAQDSAEPVLDVNDLVMFYGWDNESNAMDLAPGRYNYFFFDVYTLNNDGSPDDRWTSVTIDGPSGIIVEETYTDPGPAPAEGLVVGEFSVEEAGGYTLTIDAEDSTYWPLIECVVEPPRN